MYEQLARVYPLQFQRIVEYGYQHNGPLWTPDDWKIAVAEHKPGDALLSAFVFERTEEGEDYWWTLALAQRKSNTGW